MRCSPGYSVVFRPLLASYSAPQGYPIIESIGVMMSRQVLYGKYYRPTVFLTLIANA